MQKRQQEMDHEARMIPLKLEAAKEEAALKVFNTSVEGAAKEASNENLPWWASAVLVMTRPVLTLLLVGGATFAAFTATEQLQGELLGHLYDLASMALGWWFASRTMTRFAGKK